MYISIFIPNQREPIKLNVPRTEDVSKIMEEVRKRTKIDIDKQVL